MRYGSIIIDPTFEDILWLKEQNPNTIRVLSGTEHFLMANGYGHTHDHLYKYVRQDETLYRTLFDDLILVRYGSVWTWNMEHIDGRNDVEFRRGVHKYLDWTGKEVLFDLCT